MTANIKITRHGDRVLYRGDVPPVKPIAQSPTKHSTMSKSKTIVAVAVAASITAPLANAGYLLFADNSTQHFAYSTQYAKKKQTNRSLDYVLTTDKRIVKVVGAAHFSSGQLYLSEIELARLTAIVKKLPTGAKITVIGNSDAPGSRESNYIVALQRAQIAADHIRLVGGDVVDIISKGEDNLYADTQRSTWLNRRIDLVVKYDIKDEHTGQIRVRSDGKPYWWQKN